MHSDENAKKASLAKDEYLVAVKLLLRDGDNLLITHDKYGAWDIPGGRIRKDQFDVSLEQILEEKIKVELGNDVKYELGDIKSTIRIEREEVGRNGTKVRIFGVCYEAKYLSGKVNLGEYHDEYEWINIKTADLSKYKSTAGWVEKLDAYQESVRND